MLTKALVLTDDEADLISRVLEEVKTKTFEESQISLDDAVYGLSEKYGLDEIVQICKRRKK